jgi:hypothetical protein
MKNSCSLQDRASGIDLRTFAIPALFVSLLLMNFARLTCHAATAPAAGFSGTGPPAGHPSAGLTADVTGSSIYRQGDGAFEFRPGPVFTNLLLADEINRTPPKTQSALLEAMAERQVTIEGETRILEPPFLVIATQNPIEYEGTYPLPEAQLDRFLVRARIGYPSRDDEWQVLERRRERMTERGEMLISRMPAPPCELDQ